LLFFIFPDSEKNNPRILSQAKKRNIDLAAALSTLEKACGAATPHA
jgi:hypothetical protein